MKTYAAAIATYHSQRLEEKHTALIQDFHIHTKERRQRLASLANQLIDLIDQWDEIHESLTNS